MHKDKAFPREDSPWTLNELCWLIHNHYAKISIEDMSPYLMRSPKLLHNVLLDQKIRKKNLDNCAKDSLDKIYKDKEVMFVGRF